uniref:PAXIP1-associated glutamate-rich protein 1 n=1 Tax=Clastoptera arizonana TaxID=38151 RepID=A0A1B6CU17_9HEMI
MMTEDTVSCQIPQSFVEDWEIGCSDEEGFGLGNEITSANWEPSPEDIVDLFGKIDRGEVFQLDWQCPGRRPPTPADANDSFNDNEDERLSDLKQDIKSDFDFEEDMAQLRLSVRKSGSIEPRGSAKKKTTSLDAILSNMARHRKLDMMEDDDEHPILP